MLPLIKNLKNLPGILFKQVMCTCGVLSSEEFGALLRQAPGQAPAAPAPGVVTGGLWGARALTDRRSSAECQEAMGPGCLPGSTAASQLPATTLFVKVNARDRQPRLWLLLRLLLVTPETTAECLRPPGSSGG